MLFKRLNRTDAERVFAVFKANEAGVSADDLVALSVTGGAAAADGVGVEQPTATGLGTIVGVADAAIANGAYGLVQIYGYRSTSRINSGSVSSVTAGGFLKPVADQDYLETVASSVTANLPSFTILDSLASSSATQSAKVFIRCM